MRYCQLVEYVAVDPTKFERRAEQDNSYARYKDQIGTDFAAWLEQYDPTQKHKYVNWMINRYMKGDINRLEDIPSRIASALDSFDRLARTKKLQPDHKDINRIKDLESVVDEYQTQDTSSKSERKDEIEQQFYKSGEAKLVLNTSEYKIVIPKTEKASCYFGTNTKWCTAASNDSMFEYYSEQGDLYIILHKPENRRWQFHVQTGQYMDEQDHEIDLISFLKEHPVISETFKKLGLIDYDPKENKLTVQNSIKYYNKNGELHREDGPAFTDPDGYKHWYLNGEKHNEKGPAVISLDGKSFEYWVNGELHREDGPARRTGHGSEMWFLNGKYHREDGPAIELLNDQKEWYINGKRHREAGPALVRKNKAKEWYINGKRHREDGPAIMEYNNKIRWYVNDRWVTTLKDFAESAFITSQEARRIANKYKEYEGNLKE